MLGEGAILLYSTPGFAALTCIIERGIGLDEGLEYSIPRAEIIRDSNGAASSIDIREENRSGCLIGRRMVSMEFTRDRVG
jgi:hypothetical protein